MKKGSRKAALRVDKTINKASHLTNLESQVHTQNRTEIVSMPIKIPPLKSDLILKVSPKRRIINGSMVLREFSQLSKFTLVSRAGSFIA